MMESLPTPQPHKHLHDARDTDKYINKIKHSVREIAEILQCSKNTIIRAEQSAIDKLRMGLTCREDNTHFLAHDPAIGEIDNLFLAQPWMMWLRLPPVEGSRVMRVISRGEWEKSRV